MPADATGAPTAPDSIPTYNTSVDSPSGNGFNAAMAQIQAIITQLKAGTLASGKLLATALSGIVPVANLGSNATDTTKVLRGDSTWSAGMIKLDDQLLGADGVMNLTVPASWKYSMLRVVAYIRTATAVVSEECLIRLNTDGTTTYSWTNLDVRAGAATPTSGSNTYIQAGSVVGASGTAGYFSTLVFDVIPGAAANGFKQVVGRSSYATTPLHTDFSGTWPNVADLTSINIQALGSTNLKSGSRAILLGVA